MKAFLRFGPKISKITYIFPTPSPPPHFRAKRRVTDVNVKQPIDINIYLPPIAKPIDRQCLHVQTTTIYFFRFSFILYFFFLTPFSFDKSTYNANLEKKVIQQACCCVRSRWVILCIAGAGCCQSGCLKSVDAFIIIHQYNIRAILWYRYRVSLKRCFASRTESGSVSLKLPLKVRQCPANSKRGQ